MNYWAKHSNDTQAPTGISTGWCLALIITLMVSFSIGCKHKSRAETEATAHTTQDSLSSLRLVLPEPPLAKIPVKKEIPVRKLFQFLEEIVRQNDTLSAYKLTENLLLRANPWILDTLVHTDYYYQASIGNFIFDQQKMLVLKPGDTLVIPGPEMTQKLLTQMANTWLDINIPAFELRIMEQDSVLYAIPIRVGKNQKKHLEAAGHEVDLRTRTGTGEIFRVNRFPIFIDPVTGERFKFTKRDDHRKTLMPQIPWLEPTIDGYRYGQMIHPTTNPRSLGKPASNGCIGVSEADAWRIYYYAPLGTKVKIRYDLQEIKASGDTLHYQDIYQLQKAGKIAKMVAIKELLPNPTAAICNCDTLF
jgi:L,D-transpeptidase ErfK/SrfK